jgi:hypothetical protein
MHGGSSLVAPLPSRQESCPDTHVVEGHFRGNCSTSVSGTTVSTVDPFSVYRLPNLPIMTAIPKLPILPSP